MENYYGKLVLMNPDGPEQEYELSKTSVTPGRAMTNDIILDDSKISRSTHGWNAAVAVVS